MIDGATNWMCCDASECDSTGTGVCDYHSTTFTTGSGTVTGGDTGKQTTCSQPCNWYQTCECICFACSGVGPGCFTCKTKSWFIAAVVIFSVSFLLVIVAVSVLVFLRKRAQYMRINN